MVCIQCSEQDLFLVQPAEVIERFCDILRKFREHVKPARKISTISQSSWVSKSTAQGVCSTGGRTAELDHRAQRHWPIRQRALSYQECQRRGPAEQEQSEEADIFAAQGLRP